MEQVLTSINETASYFGDPVLKRSQIKVRPCIFFRSLGICMCIAACFTLFLCKVVRPSICHIWKSGQTIYLNLPFLPPPIPPPLVMQTQELVIDIYSEYGGRTGSLDFTHYIKVVVEHPVVVQFAVGEGTERYGSGS